MPRLIRYRESKIIAAGVHAFVVKNLPICRIRVINLYNTTDSYLGTVSVLDKNESDTSLGISLMHRLEGIAKRDLSWQGDIEFDGYQQDLYYRFEDSEGVAVTNGDAVAITIGYERI